MSSFVVIKFSSFGKIGTCRVSSPGPRGCHTALWGQRQPRRCTPGTGRGRMFVHEENVPADSWGAHGIAWTWRRRMSGQRTGHRSVAGPPETRATAPPTTGTELPALPDLTLGSGPATGYAVGSPWGPRALMGTRNSRSGGRGRGFRGCAADRWINFLRKERRYDRPSL